jgi:UDP-2,3-diacylglucosamine hydrolase
LASYFLSDIHLQPFHDERTSALIGFARTLEPGDQLFLVGDIFEFWMGGHQTWVDRYPQVVEAIIDLRKRGIEILFFEGNHDLHVDPYFERLGCKVFTTPQILNLYGRKVRVEHGDDFNPDDRGYVFLKWFLRNPFLRWASITAPGSWVTFFSDWGTGASHQRTSREGRRPEVIDDIKRRTRLYVEKLGRESDFDILVMGHTHVREDYELDIPEPQSASAAKARRIRYINLGSWYETPPRVLVIGESGITYANA